MAKITNFQGYQGDRPPSIPKPDSRWIRGF